MFKAVIKMKAHGIIVRLLEMFCFSSFDFFGADIKNKTKCCAAS